MKRRVRTLAQVAAALAATLCASCGANNATVNSDRLEPRTLIVDGQERTYYFFDSAVDAAPLVLVFHGGQGDGEKIARQSEFHKVAARHGFAVAYPDSIEYWQDGRATTGTGEYDVRFVRELIATLAETENIDRSRVYATGASNGGMFTLRLACEANDVIAAFAPVIASFPVSYVNRCEPGRAVPLLMVNGTDDRLIQWRGGNIFKGKKRGAGGTVIPVPETVSFWKQNNQCAGETEVEALPDIAPDDGTTVTRIRYPLCKAGVELELVKIEGGGHTWPSQTRTTPPVARRLVGNTSADYDASSEIWSFFSRHELQ